MALCPFFLSHPALYANEAMQLLGLNEMKMDIFKYQIKTQPTKQ